MASKQPPDYKQRERAIAGRGENLWIEAGAGTGKTTLLVNRILSLLLDDDAPTPLREIAAITFTEKAAGELKVKIREKIEEHLNDDPPDERRELLSQALRDLEIAPINTLHGFAQMLLKERPVEAGVDPGAGVLDEDAFERLLVEVYDEWFDEQVANPDPAFRWYLEQRELYERQGEWDWLWHLVRRIGHDHDVLLDITAASQFTLADARAQLLAEADEVERQAEAQCRNKKDKAYLNTREMVSVIRALPPTDDKATFFAAMDELPKFDLRGGSKKGWAEGEYKENKAKREALRETLKWLSSLREAENVWRLFALAQSFTQRFEREKRRLGALGFQDLLVRAVALLHDNEEVRGYFQRRFTYLLIDEFQDTDPLQVQIAFFLSEDGVHAKEVEQVKLKPGKLVVVGDPKQSIYRFRRADIEIYEQTKKHLLDGKEPLHIAVNFRCAPPIIDLVNRVFAPLMKLDPQLPASPDYVRLTSGRDDAPPETGVELLLPDPSACEEENFNTKALEMPAIAQWIKQAVEEKRPTIDKHTGEARPLRWRDIAVLFRSRSNFAELENVLRAEGIPYRMEGGRVYYARPEIAAVVHGLRALENPEDSLALSQWLGSDLIGFSDEALLLHVLSRQDGLSYLGEAETMGDEIANVLREMRALHRLRNRAGCLETVRNLFDCCGAIATARLLPHGDVAVANLHKVLAKAREADRQRLAFGEFVREWAEAYAEQRDESDFALTEQADDVVRVMTIHKAKGLDWPAVIVPELWKQSRNDAPLILHRRRTKELAVHLRKELETEAYSAMFEQEEKFARAERIRLLYVAMTRARDYLVLPLYGKVNKKKDKTYSAQKGFYEFLVEAGMLDDSLQVHDAAGAREVVMPAEEEGDVAPRWTLPAQGQTEKPNTTVKKLIDQAVAARKKTAIPGAEVESPLTFASPSAHEDEEMKTPRYGGRSDGLLMGNAFHALMETIELRDDAHWPQVIDAIAAAHDLNNSQRDDLRRWLANFAAMPCFPLLRESRVYREIPFTYDAADGKAYRGKIDLFAETPQGLLVLDYKTDTVEQKHLDERVEFYRHQGEIYREAVRALRPNAADVKMVFCFVDVGREAEI